MAILILVFTLLMAFLVIALLLVIFFIIISQLKFDIKCIFSATKLVIPKEKYKWLGFYLTADNGREIFSSNPIRALMRYRRLYWFKSDVRIGLSFTIPSASKRCLRVPFNKQV